MGSPWYCDHGCTLYPTAYMSTPSGAGSFPQEGDGKASGTGATPAVSVATMDFTGATAAAGATFAVHGATLTCVASGASTVQFNAGSGSTLAANLVAAINAATAAPTVTTGGVSSPYLKALVWASASGAVLTVYSRIASTDLNQSTNNACTLVCGATGNWTSPPATTNFSGGVSGPWSRMFNPSALGANINSAIGGTGTYGALVATMMSLPAAGDVLHVRTGRASADISVVLAAHPTNVTLRTLGNAGAYYEIRYDNGTIWNDGSSNGVFTYSIVATPGNMNFYFNGYTWWRGQMQSGTDVISGGVANCKFSNSATNDSPYTFALYAYSRHGITHTVIDTIQATDSNLGTSTSPTFCFTGSSPVSGLNPLTIKNSMFGIVRAAGGPFLSGSGGTSAEAIDCRFDYGGLSTFTAAIGTTVDDYLWGVKLVRPKFTGGGGGHHCLVATAAGRTCSTLQLIIEDPVDMGQFVPGDSAASFCGKMSGQTARSVTSADLSIGQFLTSNNSGRELLIDTPRRLLEWRPASFPTTGLSTLPDGTAFSVRFSVPHTGLATGLVTPMSPSRGLKSINVNTLGDNNLQITQHLLLDSSYGGSSYTPTDAEWWLEGTYVSSSDGTTKTFTTKGSGSNLTADSQSWSSLTFSPFAGASRSYSRWKITPTLTGVKNNTEISIYLVCAKQPSTMSEWCFVDMQFQLAVV